MHRNRLLTLGLLFAVLGLAALAGLAVSCAPFALGADPPDASAGPAVYDAEPTGTTHLNSLTLDRILTLDAADLTVANTTLTPAYSAYHLDSAGATTLTLTACADNGRLLVLFGDDNNTITLADSSIRTTTGNALSIGQYDLCLLVCYDTEWIELALAADS
jgi:hypothetical protein